MQPFPVRAVEIYMDVLKAKGLPVPDDSFEKIRTCKLGPECYHNLRKLFVAKEFTSAQNLNMRHVKIFADLCNLPALYPDHAETYENVMAHGEVSIEMEKLVADVLLATLVTPAPCRVPNCQCELELQLFAATTLM